MPGGSAQSLDWLTNAARTAVRNAGEFQNVPRVLTPFKMECFRLEFVAGIWGEKPTVLTPSSMALSSASGSLSGSCRLRFAAAVRSAACISEKRASCAAQEGLSQMNSSRGCA